MVSALSTDNLPPWFQNAIFRVEDTIWREGAETDTTTPAFYVYKPYPSSLKKNQIEDWVALQRRVLSPFSGGERYVFAGSQGMAFWASPDTFTGIPETAAQPALSDGEHIVRGARHSYRQRWQQRVMVECVVLQEGDERADITLDKDSGRAWAKPHPLNDALTKPVFWSALTIIVTAISLVWLGVGAATLTYQTAALEDDAADIEASLGDKLAMQTRFQQAQQLLEGIGNWQNNYAHLPQTLATVVSSVLAQGGWRADTMEWQNGKLRVELVSSELNIAPLVESLENTGMFSQVSIRPHTNPNTWNLEVTVNESAVN